MKKYLYITLALATTISLHALFTSNDSIVHMTANSIFTEEKTFSIESSSEEKILRVLLLGSINAESNTLTFSKNLEDILSTQDAVIAEVTSPIIDTSIFPGSLNR